jgi:2-C-methyl-D-erythritol 4-phosphate cytidylyltransferase
VWAIVVAGGSGRRFGGLKQFLDLSDRPVAAWSVEACRSVADGVVLVVPSNDGVNPTACPVEGMGADRTVTGGATRADSVRAGLGAVPDDAEIIVVHDAARPLATSGLFAAVVDAVRADGVEGAIPVLAVSDTLKRVVGEKVVATVDREGLVSVQTPQAFTASALRSAHRSGDEATDDAGLLERIGSAVLAVPGEPNNLKITNPDDLARAEALIHLATR